MPVLRITLTTGGITDLEVGDNHQFQFVGPTGVQLAWAASSIASVEPVDVSHAQVPPLAVPETAVVDAPPAEPVAEPAVEQPVEAAPVDAPAEPAPAEAAPETPTQ